MAITTLVLGIAAAGSVAGLLAGLLGIGGGIVIVPVLFYTFTVLDLDLAIRMSLAVGTSLSTIIVTATVSSRAHYRRGSVDLPLVRSFAPWILLGVLVGSLVAGFSSEAVMVGIFASVAMIVAIYMAFAPVGMTVADGLPSGPVRWVIATLIGGFSSLMGIGGGTLTVPTLTAVAYPAQRAVGTGAAVGLIISVPATIAMIVLGWGEAGLPPGSLGYVNLLGFLVLVPVTSLFAPLGAALAHRLSAVALRRAFALFLVVASVRMFLEQFGSI
jgi:uncharacterized membrane protein YfcA